MARWHSGINVVTETNLCNPGTEIGFDFEHIIVHLLKLLIKVCTLMNQTNFVI